MLARENSTEVTSQGWVTSMARPRQRGQASRSNPYKITTRSARNTVSSTLWVTSRTAGRTSRQIAWIRRGAFPGKGVEALKGFVHQRTRVVGQHLGDVDPLLSAPIDADPVARRVVAPIHSPVLAPAAEAPEHVSQGGKSIGG